MTSEEKRLCTQYCCNAVSEFIYFVFLYLETYGTATLDVLIKYVKFFKSEVRTLMLTFEGKTEKDKLYQLLNTLECFEVLENKVTVNKNVNLKDDIFETLIISKCVDLLLKGWNNIDDIYKNLNLNCIIKISKQNLLQIIKKYPYISVDENETVALNHVHGLLGFEDYLYNSVIGYFHNILYHGKILSYKEIRNHIKSMSFCGVSNTIGIFSVLIFSSQFECQNGYILLKKKHKKYPKKKPLHMETMEAISLSISLPVGQIVYSIYGSFLVQWSGEIGYLSESLGVIHCVVDFTNGHQGVFNIYFSKAVLKVISEIDNLKKYIAMRDVVEFDAEYYIGKRLDRCWKASRVKLLYNNKFHYDELLSAKLNSNTELQRNKCANSMCCSEPYGTMNCIEYNSLNTKDKLTGKLLKNTNYESGSLNSSVNELESASDNKFISHNEKLSNDSLVCISNTQKIDYMFMFGHIYVLMKDKGVAIAEYEGRFYNILFMKDSVSSPNKSEPFYQKGQKILAFIPYLGKLESFCVATFIYGLNEEETNKTEITCIPPKEFAVKTLLLKTRSLCSKFCRNNYLNSLQTLKLENVDTDLKYKIQLSELYKFITKQYNVSFRSSQLLLLLDSVCKGNLNGEKLSCKIFRFIVQLSKRLTNHANQKKLKRKNERKLKRVDNNHKNDIHLQELCIKAFRLTKKVNISHKSDLQSNVHELKLCTETLKKKVKSEVSIPNLVVKSKSLDVLQDSFSSLSSYKTCSSGSSEVFYSCKSLCNTPKHSSNSSLNNDNLVVTSCDCLPCETRTVGEFEPALPLPTILTEKYSILSMHSTQESQTKAQQSFKNSQCHKYLSLQSVPSLKSLVKKRKRAVFPFALKTSCTSCVRNSLKITASVSLISKSFFYFTANIDGNNVVLPLTKQDVPVDLQRKIKLNSCSEITIIPSIIINLSHVMAARIIV